MESAHVYWTPAACVESIGKSVCILANISFPRWYDNDGPQISCQVEGGGMWTQQNPADDITIAFKELTKTLGGTEVLYFFTCLLVNDLSVLHLPKR